MHFFGNLINFISFFSLRAQNLTRDMADYCTNRMKPYIDPKTGQPINGALDYIDFTRTLFQN